MATVLPRINVPFDATTYRALRDIAGREKISLSEMIRRLVSSALELSEDLVLAEIASKRLATFRRDDALSSDELLRRIHGRWKKKG